jgi:hypothetical protein
MLPACYREYIPFQEPVDAWSGFHINSPCESEAWSIGGDVQELILSLLYAPLTRGG